ncbi:hypothetical protein ACFYY1_35460 [Streptomyces sp. NPDC001890]|uniref:hypothetical protein n=1 Tax=Streptomyces sp. NPDC001890 TaxID=3364620 RepID=UPI00368582C2
MNQDESTMKTKHVARLRFESDGPVVEGEWALPKTAEDQYRKWVGLYSKNPNVVVCLIEKTNDRERLLRTWTEQGETTQTYNPRTRAGRRAEAG